MIAARSARERQAMWDHLPLIVVEVVMIFGGALTFGWWQLRDLDREKRLRERRQQRTQEQEREQAHMPPPAPARANDPASTSADTGGHPDG